MPSLLHRPYTFFRIWALKAFVRLLLLIWRATDPVRNCAPTIIKTYPVRPKLRNRIFIPRSYASHQKPLPLYLDIHGGGWTVFDPEVDDEFCSYFANTFGVLVVSIAYHRAPRNPFPGPVEDVAAIASAVIADTSLPIDRSKIAAGGFSAGGTLALAISQKPDLHHLIKGAVCFFAPTDFGTTVEQKMADRLQPDKRDMLAGILPIFNDAYIPQGTNLLDPLLSPIYAKRDSLPLWLYMIGAEEDCLCIEDKAFAEKMAGLPKGSVGKGPVELNGNVWEVGPVKWEMVKGVAHNFTHLKKRKEDEEKHRRDVNTQLYERIFDWLKTGPWA